MSSDESRRWEVMEQMCNAAEDCSRYIQWRLEMLGCLRLRGGYGEQSSWDSSLVKLIRQWQVRVRFTYCIPPCIDGHSLCHSWI